MSTRYYGKKMSRSLSSSAIFHDPKTDTTFMTVREGKKVYRVPVMVVHDPSRQIEEVASGKNTVSKRKVDPVQTHIELSQRNKESAVRDPQKAFESLDGNWTMKSHDFAKAENAMKRSLQLRNNAVSELFVPPEHIQQRHVRSDHRYVRSDHGHNRMEYEVRRSKTPEPRAPYLRTHERKPKHMPSTLPISRPDGSASVYVTHPVGATLPRARMRSDGAVTHVQKIYHNPVQPLRSISVPAPVYRPPSPSSTIRDFEMSEDSTPSSPNNLSSSEIHVRNMYQPADHLVGPVQTSTPPASTRIYVKRSHSDESSRKGSLHTGKARRHLSEDTYLRPGYEATHSQTNTYSSGSNRMYSDQADGSSLDYRERTSTTHNRSRHLAPDAAVYRGEVVRVQVPAYKTRDELTPRKAPIPDEYHTYPELRRRNNANLNQATTTRTTTQKTEAVMNIHNLDNEETNFGSVQTDNEQKTDINANKLIVSDVDVHTKSDGESQSRSVLNDEVDDDNNMYSIAFIEHF